MREALGTTVAPHHEIDQAHLAKAYEESWDYTPQEQRANGDAADGAIDDKQETGRDQGADRRRGDGQRCAEGEVVAGLVHPGDQDLTDRGGVRGRHALDAAEQHADDDVDVGQSTAQARDEDLREVDQALGYAAAIHDFAGQDEERQGEIDKALKGDDHLLRDDRERYRAQDYECERRYPERENDRNTEEQEHEKQGEEKRCVHYCAPLGGTGALSPRKFKL